MKGKEKAAALLAGGAMLGLILDSKTALSGCGKGLELCVKSVIPALLPFLVLSPILTASLGFRLPKGLARRLKLPQGADPLLIAGCVGGYPVGAQCIAAAAKCGQISRRCAHRLMAFCCNCGPGFIFGICSSYFSHPWAPWVLWLCHVGAAFLLGVMIPAGENAAVSVTPQPCSAMDAFGKAIKAMANICGWVILFRCLLEYWDRWLLWRVSRCAAVLITGTLELTNGCLSLSAINSEDLRFVLCEAMLSFGGLCVAMQTASVTQGIGLGLYIPGKLGQMVLSSLLAYGFLALVQGKWVAFLALGCFLATAMAVTKEIFRKKEITSRNLRPMVV